MGGRCTGWPEQAFDVLLKLEGDPPVAVRESLREEREELVRQPMIALMQDLVDTDASHDNFTVPGFHITFGPWQRQVMTQTPQSPVAGIEHVPGPGTVQEDAPAMSAQTHGRIGRNRHSSAPTFRFQVRRLAAR